MTVKKSGMFILGTVFGLALSVTSVAVAANTELVAKVVNYKINVNGKEQKFDNKVVSIDGTTYLSVRDVGKATGYKVGYKGGVVSLTSGGIPSTDIVESISNPSQSDFKVLPITKKFKDYTIAVNSIELTEVSAIINLTVKNDSSLYTTVEFSNRLFGYNYGIEGKQGTGGTTSVKNFPKSVDANSESTGTVEMGSKGLDADYFVFNVTVDNQRDQPVIFLIKK
jgi:hypothetical protein